MVRNDNRSIEQRQKEENKQRQNENKPGFGDKKLEGPNRPST
ncbi:hypothetical protein ACJ2A9_09935 [Anaerobacillus sp. MEB173]